MARLFKQEDIRELDDPSMVRLPTSLWARLSRIAKLESDRAEAENANAKKISRNDVIKKVLREFADTYEKEELDAPEKKNQRK